eukprot:TRINITY_DN5092_c0_g3_i1.p1 TRINITY_DN5092_c0_g3~~TRINITY_DN5092_c0_g3_i1.p1  ORF type:complete len:963 (-),score=219.82 TRINITY_DN5092_c0_g3_i1:155-3043(-)
MMSCHRFLLRLPSILASTKPLINRSTFRSFASPSARFSRLSQFDSPISPARFKQARLYSTLPPDGGDQENDGNDGEDDNDGKDDGNNGTNALAASTADFVSASDSADAGNASPLVFQEQVNAIRNQMMAETPERVMVVPIHKRPFFPNMFSPIVVDDAIFKRTVLEWVNQHGPNNASIGIVLARDDAAAKVTDLAQLYPVGILSTVYDTGHQKYLLALGFYRIRLVSIDRQYSVSGRLVARIARVQDEEYDEFDVQIRAQSAEILESIRELEKALADASQPRSTPLGQMQGTPQHAAELADIGAAICLADKEKLQAVIECTDIKERQLKTIYLLKAEIEAMRIQAKIRNSVEESISKSHRKFMLNEQLKMIKKELGIDKDEKSTVIDKFKEALKGKTVPPDAQKVIDDELAKLSTLEPQSSEYNVTRNYLDWLTVLPWGVHAKENFDIEHATKVLDEDHYGLKDIKERILEFIAVGALKQGLQGKILCFVGPPGVGKTSIGKSIARALNREFYRFSVGGLSDVAEIKGHRRTYIGAMPGKLIQALKLVKVSNPVILIDEIDKLGHGYQGDPASALLEVLDPAQNSSFNDHYLDVPVDLSKVLFVCTANVKDTIPGPLLDRMELINLSGYILEEKLNIAKRYLIPRAQEDSGLKAEQVVLADSVVRTLIRSYAREAGVRSLQKLIERIFRKAAFQVVKDKSQHVEVTDDVLNKFVGKPIFTSDRYFETTPPGVVMGLAWTAMGGATLYVETIVDKIGQKADLRCTGQMGDVMKESTDIAYSYAKAFLPQVARSNRFFKKASVHMHIPEGATPKDGPSAGVTMVTALLSLALNKPIRQNLAMTGELTLTGVVLPIGGVKEKTIAAQRSGVKYIMFPKENKRDFDELDDNIKEGLEPFFAASYKDVYDVAFSEPTEASVSKDPVATEKPTMKHKQKAGKSQNSDLVSKKRTKSDKRQRKPEGQEQ